MAKQHLALVLVTLLPGLFCYNPDDGMETIVFSTNSKDALYYEVEGENEADLVLLLEVKMPEDHYTSEFYLKRNPRPKRNYIGSAIGYGFASCGATPEGKGVGLGGSISLNVSDVGVIKVEMSFYWTSTKGNKGTLDGNIEVPWLGESTKDLSQGAQAHLSFRAPKK